MAVAKIWNEQTQQWEIALVGASGPAGPNYITTTTGTDLTGFLKGDGTNVFVDNSTYLSLDQTTPQTVTGGVVNFTEGLETEKIIFDTTYEADDEVDGTLFWHGDDSTLDLVVNQGFTTTINQDVTYLVKNQTGQPIPKGTAVKFAGALGVSGRILVEPMIADGTSPSEHFMGLTAEQILNGEDGFVFHFGKLRKFDTNGVTLSTGFQAWQEGDILYVSETDAGLLTNVRPEAPNNIITAAAVVAKDNNGVLQIRATFEPKLENLQDVDHDAALTSEGLLMTWNNTDKYFEFTNNINDYSEKIININAQTGTSYILAASDISSLVTLNNANPVTVTVPDEATVPFADGTVIALSQLGDGVVTVSPSVGVTINSLNGLFNLSGKYATASLIKLGTNNWLLSGGLA